MEKAKGIQCRVPKSKSDEQQLMDDPLRQRRGETASGDRPAPAPDLQSAALP
jgi:hypothetical protein